MATAWLIGARHRPLVLACAMVLACCVNGPGSDHAFAQRRGREGGTAGASRGRGRAESGTPAMKHEIRDAAKRRALCNDGSPAAFYFRPGKDPDRNKWIVFFQGGGGCATDATCMARWADQHNLTTSSGLQMRQFPDNFLSGDEHENPDFARFAIAVVHYCSSDAYAGDTERQVGGQTWQFRGRRIVDAVVDELMDRSVVGTPTLRQATDVLIAGSSAGALGVHNNLDRLAVRLTWAHVKGLADSGWLPEIEPYGPGTLDVRPDAAAARDYVNAQPDESCAAANPSQMGKCLFESFVFPYLTTPMFVYADQRDPLHLGTYGIHRRGQGESPGEREYVQEYGRRLRESLANVPAAFSPSIGFHTSLGNERYRTAVIDGVTPAQAIGRWYFARPGPIKLIAPPS
jgi:O-palmitoleoyl-L-serine hydrolase